MIKARMSAVAAVLAALAVLNSCGGPVSGGCKTASTSGHCPGSSVVS